MERLSDDVTLATMCERSRQTISIMHRFFLSTLLSTHVAIRGKIANDGRAKKHVLLHPFHLHMWCNDAIALFCTSPLWRSWIGEYRLISATHLLSLVINKSYPPSPLFYVQCCSVFESSPLSHSRGQFDLILTILHPSSPRHHHINHVVQERSARCGSHRRCHCDIPVRCPFVSKLHSVDSEQPACFSHRHS